MVKVVKKFLNIKKRKIKRRNKKKIKSYLKRNCERIKIRKHIYIPEIHRKKDDLNLKENLESENELLNESKSKDETKSDSTNTLKYSFQHNVYDSDLEGIFANNDENYIKKNDVNEVLFKTNKTEEDLFIPSSLQNTQTEFTINENQNDHNFFSFYYNQTAQTTSSIF